METEVFGVDYERYALRNLIGRMVKKFKIKNVLELPAFGVKAMPSVYSIAFAEFGCDVSLVNPNLKFIKKWEELGYHPSIIKSESIYKLPVKDNQFDFVWNFAIFPEIAEKEKLLFEMVRASRRYVFIVAANGYNVGAYVHRALHKIKDVPWTHGDKKLLYYQNLKGMFKKAGLSDLKLGFVDTPPWPDAIGFRDMRLHREKINIHNVEWRSRNLEYIKDNSYPLWMKLVYGFESIPIPMHLKLLYAHMYYLMGLKSCSDKPRQSPIET